MDRDDRIVMKRQLFGVYTFLYDGWGFYMDPAAGLAEYYKTDQLVTEPVPRSESDVSVRGILNAFVDRVFAEYAAAGSPDNVACKLTNRDYLSEWEPRKDRTESKHGAALLTACGWDVVINDPGNMLTIGCIGGTAEWWTDVEQVHQRFLEKDEQHLADDILAWDLCGPTLLDLLAAVYHPELTPRFVKVTTGEDDE